MSNKMKVLALLFVSLLASIALLGISMAGDATNPFAGNKDAIAEGQEIFDEYCSECHGTGTGGSGPNLIDEQWLYGGSDAEVFASVSNGRMGGMPSFSYDLKEDQIWKVIAYIRSIKQ